MGLLEFINELSKKRDLPVLNIVFSPHQDYATIYLRFKFREDRDKALEIVEIARRHGLIVSVYIEKVDAAGKRRNMIIVREVSSERG